MTEQVNLGGAWRMREADSETWHSAHVPGSVYADLMADGTMPDPFWRENELDAFERMKKDYVYQRTFTVSEAQLAHVHVELVCEGLRMQIEPRSGHSVGMAEVRIDFVP